MSVRIALANIRFPGSPQESVKLAADANRQASLEGAWSDVAAAAS
jgi:hypothetical protein